LDSQYNSSKSFGSLHPILLISINNNNNYDKTYFLAYAEEDILGQVRYPKDHPSFWEVNSQ